MTTSSTAPQPTLTTQTPGGVTVGIPAGWTQVPQPSNIVYGDHVDYLYISPSDPNEQMLVIADHCSGCVLTGPVSLAPAGAKSVVGLSASKAGFQASGNARSLSGYWSDKGIDSLASGYQTDGAVVIAPPSSSPAYAVAAVTLAAAKHSLATQILDSVSIPATPGTPGTTTSGSVTGEKLPCDTKTLTEAFGGVYDPEVSTGAAVCVVVNNVKYAEQMLCGPPGIGCVPRAALFKPNASGTAWIPLGVDHPGGMTAAICPTTGALSQAAVQAFLHVGVHVCGS
ncbi:MAG: hypothetical protein M3083_19215 [Actinomycetota bacterium]|nr:hypothetical protein [Actinomycetota bacterium]MDQ6948275.1 hypothetical protein [Actinomycetota bacterium]